MLALDLDYCKIPKKMNAEHVADKHKLANNLRGILEKGRRQEPESDSTIHHNVCLKASNLRRYEHTTPHMIVGEAWH
jgi:hypothetical protein